MTIAILDERSIAYLPIASLFPSATNPRKTLETVALAQLAESIKRTGVNVPLIVRPKDFGADIETYEIVAGFRRWSAAQIADLAELPCIVRELSDAEAAEVAIVDNLQRILATLFALGFRRVDATERAGGAVRVSSPHLEPDSYQQERSKDRAPLWTYAKRFGVDPDKIAAQFEKAAAEAVVSGTNSEKKGGRGDSPEPEPGGVKKKSLRAAKPVVSAGRLSAKAAPKKKAAKKAAAKGKAK